mgnify:CR=1 FL=1
MAIPLVSNVAFTEITQSLVDSNSGVLNDIAGTAKSKLPVQYFKLGENISGNLTMSADSAHQKIILDTGGRTLLNSTGSPLTNNSSTAMELKGSGNIQSTLKTSTKTVDTTSHTGTTVFDNTNSSSLVVGTNHTFDTSSQTVSFTWVNVPSSTGDSDARNGGRYPQVPTGTTLVMGDGTLLTAGQGLSLDVWLGSGNGISQTHVDEIFGNNGQDLTANGNRTSGVGGTYSVTAGGNIVINSSTTGSWSGGTIYNSVIPGSSAGNLERLSWSTRGGLVGRTDLTPQGSVIAGNRTWTISAGSAGGLTVRNTGRKFTFTNLMTQASTGDNAATYTLSGADPFDGVTVGHSGGGSNTAVSNRDSTDGSFNITLTISGTDANNKPYVLVDVNNGTGSIDTSTQSYSGTLSTKAFS